MHRDVAIALGYRPELDLAPKVVASGEGLWAERIRSLAAEHDIPLHSDPDLADLLRHLPLEEEIPPELYPAIAEIFLFLCSVAKEMREEGNAAGSPASGGAR